MTSIDEDKGLARSRAAASVHGGQGADLLPTRVEGAAAAAPATPGPSDGAPRRTGRGFVNSFGDGRVCAVSECLTALSRYNPKPVCAIHDTGHKSTDGHSFRGSRRI